MRIRSGILMLSFLVFSTSCLSQGIHFEEQLSWQEIRDKAAKENKFIFVDCYATWCVPCKQMDKTIYVNDTVAAYFNDHFVSVKVQMDSTKKDNQNITKFYPLAREFEKNYDISALPSYLFFSPEGKIVHKQFGLKSVSEFIALGSDATDPSKQLFTQLDLWRTGRLSFQALASLALKLKRELNDKDQSKVIAQYYQKEYLNKLSDSEYLAKENLVFIGSFTSIISLHDKAFNLFRTYPKIIDSILETPNFSTGMVNYIIAKDMIDPALKESTISHSKPQWNSLIKSIRKRFGSDLALRTITSAKVRWYKNDKQNPQYIENVVKEMEQQGLASVDNSIAAIFLNGKAYDVFLYSGEEKYLRIALVWIDHALSFFTDLPTGMLDTKANLLYRLNQREDAIRLQEQAVELSHGKRAELNEHLEKMKKGLPTWIVLAEHSNEH